MQVDQHQQLHTFLEIVFEMLHLFLFHFYVFQQIFPNYHEKFQIVAQAKYIKLQNYKIQSNKSTFSK
jgi:hypothetical protein